MTARDLQQLGRHPVWTPALVRLGLLLVLLGVGLWDVWTGMVLIWHRSETFAHAFLVLPISLWLIWRQRDLLCDLPVRAWWPGVPLMAAVAVLTVFAELMHANAVMHAGFVSLVILSVITVMGWRVARAVMFPLGFLLFAVPTGEFLMPALMASTADFTVWAVRASGVPLYRDGLMFVIPTGNWSVVEACSGLRYLIASLMVGTLFAYLNFKTWRARLVFSAFAMLLPIFANWLRAYMIVMIGHLSGNELATGVDHLVYGWVFFGIVMFAMFAVGMRWSDGGPALVRDGGAVLQTSTPEGVRKAWSVTLTASLALAAPMVLGWSATHRAVSSDVTLDRVPSWGAEAPVFSPSLSAWRPKAQNPNADRLDCAIVEGAPVCAYVAYYRDQSPERKLVSSVNQPVFADKNWRAVAESVTPPLGSGPGWAETLLQPVIMNTQGSAPIQAWRLYWVDGQWVRLEWQVRLRMAWQRFLGRGDDGAVVVIYAPAGQKLLPSSVEPLMARLAGEFQRVRAAGSPRS